MMNEKSLWIQTLDWGAFTSQTPLIQFCTRRNFPRVSDSKEVSINLSNRAIDNLDILKLHTKFNEKLLGHQMV